MNKIVWIGNRLSDIEECKDLFYASLNLYGDEEFQHQCFNRYRVNNNTKNDDANDFFATNIEKYIHLDNNIKFMFYNPKKAYDFPESVRTRTICLNDYYLLECLSDKISCHNVLNSIVKFIPYIVLLGKDINICFLKKLFAGQEKFVVQDARSSGGFGTFILCEKNLNEIKKIINKNQRYLVSIYIENSISFNVHAIIGEYDHIIFPPSLQIIQKDTERLLFRGSDFINASYALNLSSIEKIIKKIIAKIEGLGYRGIVGFDMLQDLDSGEQFLVELNCRFQGSSFLINKSLKENKLANLQELNIKAFSKMPLNGLVPKELTIRYGAVFFYKHRNTPINIPNAINSGSIYDGLFSITEFEDFSYLYKQIYKS